MISLGFLFWLHKRSSDRWVKYHARDTIRALLRQQWHDYKPRGRGSRAWRRAAALYAGCFHLGGGIYIDCRRAQ